MGSGRTANISRCGLLFSPSGHLPAGETIEAVVDWPADRSPGNPLQLRVWGQVVRSDASSTAIRIERYRFQPHWKDATAQPAAADAS